MTSQQTVQKPRGNQTCSILSEEKHQAKKHSHNTSKHPVAEWQNREKPWHKPSHRSPCGVGPSFTVFDPWLPHTDFLNSYLCWLLRAQTTTEVRTYPNFQMKTFLFCHTRTLEPSFFLEKPSIPSFCFKKAFFSPGFLPPAHHPHP